MHFKLAVLTYAAATAAWSAIILAALLSEIQACEDTARDAPWSLCSLAGDSEINGYNFTKATKQHVIQISIVLVPMMGGLFQTMLSQFQYKEKWVAAKLAAAEIVKHIFLFRGAVDAYSTAASSQDASPEPEGDDEALSSAAKTRLSRMKFAAKVTSTYSSVLTSLSGEFLQTAPDGDSLVKEGLPEHAWKLLYNRQPTNVSRAKSRRSSCCSCWWCCCCLPRISQRQNRGFAALQAEEENDTEAASYTRLSVHLMDQIPVGDVHRAAGGEYGDDDEEEKEDVTKMDDCLSPMSAEAYFEKRVLMLIHQFETQAPELSAEQSFTNYALILCTFASSVLGALRYSAFIPVVLGFAALLNSIMAHRASSTRLNAINTALAGLRGLEVQYTAMSNMDRRTPSFKRTLCSKAEQLAFDVVKTWAGSAMTFDDSTVIEEDKDEEKKKADAKKKTKP